MASPARARAAWIVPAICAALLLAAVLWERRTDSGVLADVEVLANVPLSLGFALVGALIVSRRPGNRLGLLYLGSATAMALTVFVYEYAYDGLVTPPARLPGALAAAWVSSWIWALGFAPLFTLGLLIYPDARLPLAPLALAGARVWRSRSSASPSPGRSCPGPFLNHPVADNPLGLEGAGPALEAIGAAGFPLVLFGLAAGVTALAVRWRRSPPGGIERRQLFLLLLVTAAVPGRHLRARRRRPALAGRAAASSCSRWCPPRSAWPSCATGSTTSTSSSTGRWSTRA